jgi:hypothetical protein
MFASKCLSRACRYLHTLELLVRSKRVGGGDADLFEYSNMLLSELKEIFLSQQEGNKNISRLLQLCPIQITETTALPGSSLGFTTFCDHSNAFFNRI